MGFRGKERVGQLFQYLIRDADTLIINRYYYMQKPINNAFFCENLNQFVCMGSRVFLFQGIAGIIDNIQYDLLKQMDIPNNLREVHRDINLEMNTFFSYLGLAQIKCVCKELVDADESFARSPVPGERQKAVDCVANASTFLYNPIAQLLFPIPTEYTQYHY